MPPTSQPAAAETATLPTQTVHATACTLDCPDTCSLDVTVEDGRVTGIAGSDRNPLTAGFICAKVRGFDRHLYADERVPHPLVRAGRRGGGEWRRASWDDALDLVADRMRKAVREHGAETVLPLSYGGSNGYLSQDTTDARLFRRLGASRLLRTVCAAATGRAAEGLYGRMPGVALEDYVHAKLIVVWGANPPVTGIHLVPVIREAQRRGARLVVVDPRRTPLARGADLHLQLRPGSDLPVALAIHRWLFEHDVVDREALSRRATGVDELERRAAPWTLERAAQVAGVEAAALARFAALYAEADPAAIRCGWGPERNRHGGSAIAAILALPAIAGKFGCRGGGYTLSNSAAWRLDPAATAGEPEPPTRAINMNRVGEALIDAEPPITALFVYNANPLATLPRQELVRQGLMREDLFTVVFDAVMTDTAQLADVVLPATTFLEHRDLRRGYGTYALLEAQPVIEPIGEARPNLDVFADLCRRLDLVRPGEPETDDEIASALLAQAHHENGGTPKSAVDSSMIAARENGGTPKSAVDSAVSPGPAEALRTAGIAWPPTGPAPVQLVDVFPGTVDGKIHLVPAELDAEAPLGLYGFDEEPPGGAAAARYPLQLISPATPHTVSSTFGQLKTDAARLELHADDASVRGIAAGTAVRVWNDFGEVRCIAQISADLRPGVALLPKGLWARHTRNGATANAVAPDTLTDLGGGACFNDARVEVEAE